MVAESDSVVRAWAPTWLRRLSVVLAAAYLVFVWFDAVENSLLTKWLPAPARPFVQVAGLFPHAAEAIIEWHILGYHCDAGRFEELDVRPYFRIHADDKESRFDRALFFYHSNHRVMLALDEYVSEQATRHDGQGRVGGVMVLDVRLPIPELGSPAERYQRRPIVDYPRELRHYFYTTSIAERERRCGEAK